ncbi:hypothetical protein LUZ60_003143 [Juncus effusus]|nr:hypothetical protein LUZ60_003143 [Juncus effusus]
MATEEVSKPPSLPPYPELILTALKSLNEKEGSNKSAISKYIESKYGELPESHTSLLTAHLARMKESGELIFLKNNYFVPGPGSPPKRGRGRPPKAKDPDAPAAPAKEPGSPKPRGRPPKPKDPIAEAVAKATSGMPKSRGRPPKKPRGEAGADAGVPAKVAAPGGKKGRGRPPKVKPAAVEETNNTSD